jgi:hypothetical protein
MYQIWYKKSSLCFSAVAKDVHARGAHHRDKNGYWLLAIGYRLSAIGYPHAVAHQNAVSNLT